jgi:hemerythrin superfamily protein
MLLAGGLLMALKAGVLEVVLGDHDRIRSLFTMLLNTGAEDKRRRDLYSELRRELTRHSMFEEEMVYPHLRSKTETRELARISTVQHATTDRLLTMLDRTDRRHPTFDKTIRELHVHVLEHMQLEEEQVLHYVRSISLSNNSPYLQLQSFGKKIREKAARYRS